MSMPRGIRNNNPGNIDRNPNNKWLGLATDQSSDKRFCVFVAPEYGIRALIKLIQNYAKQGNNTIRKIINKYAPSNENNTGVYIKQVCEAVGSSPDDILDLSSYIPTSKLVKAIIRHENGVQPYSDDLLKKAWDLLKCR